MSWFKKSQIAAPKLDEGSLEVQRAKYEEEYNKLYQYHYRLTQSLIMWQQQAAAGHPDAGYRVPQLQEKIRDVSGRLQVAKQNLGHFNQLGAENPNRKEAPQRNDWHYEVLKGKNPNLNPFTMNRQINQKRWNDMMSGKDPSRR